MDHLRQVWAAVALPESNARFVHFFLPDDADAAYRALVEISRRGRHAAQESPSEYDQGRLHDLIAHEGFSHHPVHGAAPSSGFMASYEAPEGSGIAQVHHINQIGPEHIAAHRRLIAEHLSQPASYQGGWHDTSDGSVYLDASRHFPNEHDAREFAADQKQKAYFKLDDFTERFMDPHQDPLAMKDQHSWEDRYSAVGTGPHSRYASYRHLYPSTEDQKKFWGDQGYHLAGKGMMEGRPVGPWRSNQWVEGHRHG